MIGNTLKKLRETRGYSLRTLARLSQLSHSFISDIENGRCNPSINSLCRIANALNVEPHIFLNSLVVNNDRNVINQ